MISFADKIIRAHQCPSVGIDNFVLISEYSWTNNPCQSSKSVVKTSLLFFLHLIINSRIFFLNLRVIIPRVSARIATIQKDTRRSLRYAEKNKEKKRYEEYGISIFKT